MTANPYESPQTAPVLTDHTDEWNVIWGFAWGVLWTVAVMDALRALREMGWI